MFLIADLFRLRPRNVRHRLLRDLTLVILVTSGAIVALAVSSASSTERRTARAHIERASVQAREEFRSRMAPVDRRLRLAWEWGKAGLLDDTDRPGVLAKLAPLLDPLTMVTALIVADSRGRELHLSRGRNAEGQPEGWVTRSRGLAGVQGRLLLEHWSEDRELLGTSWIELPGYVPTERPWFIGALEAPSEEELFRTEPYRFLEANRLGVTQSMRWTPKDGNTRVIAFDLLLDDVFSVVGEIRVSEGSETFLCNSRGEVFVPSGPPTTDDGPVALQHAFVAPEAIRNSLIEGAVSAWRAAGGGGEAPVRFRAGEVSGWAGFRLMDPLSGILIGVAVPDPEIFGAAVDWTPQIVALLVLILLVGVLFGASIVRKYSHQLRDVPEQRVRPVSFARDVQALIARGEGPTLEFKSTVRMNLRSGKTGKEIELAWLKAATAFMNTDGGTLLIGVGDDGEIVGVEPDQFESEDKCRLHLKNLVNQHIGPELSPFIQFEVQAIEGTTVVVVQCERSTKPVFLKAKNKEVFHVRSGPSSVELSSREVLEYLERRA